MSLKELKKNSAALKDRLSNAAKETKKGGKGKSAADSRFWQPTVDQAGNGTAVIRFLPPKDGEQDYWVQLWRHAFRGKTGQWYIENSRTTIGEKDPVSDYNTALWETGEEDKKKIASAQKRKLLYISNILVISDPKNPQNEGKVFLYSYGQKIFDKLNDAMHPGGEDEAIEGEDAEEGINPFDFWTGADFKLVVRNVGDFRNYDKSKFLAPKALFGGDEGKLEEVYNQIYSLKEFTDPSNFKSYDELQKKFLRVIGESATGKPSLTVTSGGAGGKVSSAKRASVMETDDDDDTDTSDTDDDDATTASGDEDVDTLDELSRLAEDDE